METLTEQYRTPSPHREEPTTKNVSSLIVPVLINLNSGNSPRAELLEESASKQITVVHSFGESTEIISPLSGPSRAESETFIAGGPDEGPPFEKDPNEFYNDRQSTQRSESRLDELGSDMYDEAELTAAAPEKNAACHSPELLNTNPPIRCPTVMSPRSAGVKPLSSVELMQSFVPDYWKMFRKETRILGMSHFVILFAIPLFKRNGQKNNRWISGELVWRLQSDEAWQYHPLEFVCDDPFCGDGIFRGAIPMTELNNFARISFYLQNRGLVEEDRPGLTSDGSYESPTTGPGIVSLRDGNLTLGDTALDVGIGIHFVSGRSSVPIMHFFDECTGQWSSRRMSTIPMKKANTEEDSSRDYYCFLLAKRALFVIEQDCRFTKSSIGDGNIYIGSPGCFTIYENGQIVRVATVFVQ